MVWWRRLKEKVGWVSVGRREDCLKGRTAGDVPEMLNEISSSSLSPLRSRVLYRRTLGEMHPRVCVRMSACVCVGRFFLDSHSTSLHHVFFFLSLFVRAVCVFFFFVFAKDWRPVLGALCTRRHRQSFYTHTAQADDSVFIG